MRVNTDTDRKKLFSMNIWTNSILENKVWSWKKSLFKKYVLHETIIKVDKTKIKNFFDLIIK